SHAALYAHQRGAKIVAVSDVGGGVYNKHGLDIPKLIEHYKSRKTLEGFSGVDRITNEELLCLDVKALIPAALDGAIDAKLAESVKTKLIIEGANGPVTAEASHILIDRGVKIIPDILANGGGVIVSYFEWVQGVSSYFWGEDEVNAK